LGHQLLCDNSFGRTLHAADPHHHNNNPQHRPVFARLEPLNHDLAFGAARFNEAMGFAHVVRVDR
jgi:hypothetical protein